MPADVYRRLAERLDSLPQGFPATASGVELRLLEKIFAPEEAELAAIMSLTPMRAAEVAALAGRVEDDVYKLLKVMARKGQIAAWRGKGGFLFQLMPFIVGIYEAQLSRLDVEMADLFEQYFLETRGGTALAVPALQRIIPVETAISAEIEVFPYESASALLEAAKSWGVRRCICRVQRQLIGQGCQHPVENCLIYAPVENAFHGGASERVISKDEALRILREAADAGLVHSTMNHRGNSYYICNCCTCSCGVLRSVAEFGNPSAVARSDFRATVDESACTGCGACVARCQFHALSADGVAVVDPARCLGCGVCVGACPSGALRLERRPDASAPPPDMDAWLAERANSRGIPPPA